MSDPTPEQPPTDPTEPTDPTGQSSTVDPAPAPGTPLPADAVAIEEGMCPSRWPHDYQVTCELHAGHSPFQLHRRWVGPPPNGPYQEWENGWGETQT